MFQDNLNLLVLFKTKVDRVQGADPTSLENKIQQYYGNEDSEDGESSVQGHVSSDSICFIFFLYTEIDYFITSFNCSL